ncbi:MAG: chemotaxis protein [Desulfuromonadaceae bacterium]|nr:chemotaxis protein [Desulfuromonadaceae bacterium]MDD5104765.1 chemotaxis protein [Desulfuromonadaceae bacterium]
MAEKNGILLESGTNELEIVEFCINDGESPLFYGVNVAKVREIIQKPELRSVVNASPFVAGMMTLRDKVLPVIDLCQILGLYPGKAPDRIVVLEFNRVVIGVLVNSVSRIYRLSWEQIEAPHKLAGGSYITGLVKMENRIILILDFERIIAEMFQEGAVIALNAEELSAHDGTGRKILVADDSSFIRLQICSSLRGANYTVEEATNGQEAWDYIERTLANGTFDIDAVITDIEMPQMDGLHLVTLIRGQEALSRLPVYVFSSLASDDNIKKWEKLAINGVLTKPDLPKLVGILGEVLAGA